MPGLLLTPGGYHWLQRVIIDSRELSLTPGGYHWFQGVIIDSRELSLTPGSYHWLQGVIIDSRGLSLTPGSYHWLQGVIIDSRGLSLSHNVFFKNRDSLEYLCEGYPGFITKFKAAAGPEDPKASHTDTVDFENYRHVCHKWHYKVRKFSRMYFY